MKKRGKFSSQDTYSAARTWPLPANSASCRADHRKLSSACNRCLTF